jgi:hypothetical protein
MTSHVLLLLLLTAFVVGVQALMNVTDWWLNKWCVCTLSVDIEHLQVYGGRV